MSSSIQGLAGAGLISDPNFAANASDPSEFTSAVSTSNLVVNGNTIDTGRYVIIASTNSTHGSSSSADDGQLTVYDKQTNSYVNIWGDPHLTASDGNLAEFQTNGLTLDLPDGTQVEIEPTALSNGVAHIAEATVTKNGQTILLSNFEGQAGPQVTVGPILQGDAKVASSTMDNTSDTVLEASSTDIGAWSLTGGQALTSTGSQINLDGMGGGIAQYFNNFNTAASLGMASAEANGQAASTSGTNTPSDTGAASSSSTIPTSTVADASALLESIQAQSNPDFGNSLATINAMLDQVLGIPIPSSSPATAATTSVSTADTSSNISPATNGINIVTTASATPTAVSGASTSSALPATSSTMPVATTPVTAPTTTYATVSPSETGSISTGVVDFSPAEQIGQITTKAAESIHAVLEQSSGAGASSSLSTGQAAAEEAADMLLNGAGAVALKSVQGQSMAPGDIDTVIESLNQALEPSMQPAAASAVAQTST